MLNKSDWIVKSIKKFETYEWLKFKHYAKRLPMAIEYSFGLYSSGIIVGVCTFGPPAPPVPITIFGEIGKFKVRELTRLVSNDDLPRNALSFFVSKCLKFLPTMCVVSFSDSKMGHHGYIYQATNFYYTGIGGGDFEFIDENGIEIHTLTINDCAKSENLTQEKYCQIHNINKVKSDPKYRYLYFVGNKRETKEMKENLLLKILPYPKGDNKNYNTDHKPIVQLTMF